MKDDTGDHRRSRPARTGFLAVAAGAALPLARTPARLPQPQPDLPGHTRGW